MATRAIVDDLSEEGNIIDTLEDQIEYQQPKPQNNFVSTKRRSTVKGILRERHNDVTYRTQLKREQNRSGSIEKNRKREGVDNIALSYF